MISKITSGAGSGSFNHFHPIICKALLHRILVRERMTKQFCIGECVTDVSFLVKCLLMQ